MDPQQSPGRTGPTQPVPQGTPGWGPAAQAPGASPPPVPGQAPPQLPAQPPGAPSAWSRQVPATPPQDGAPAAGRSRGGARRWLIGGGAALAVAAIVGVVVATSGDEGKSTTSEKPPGVPGGPAEPPRPAEKTYTKAPEGCSLIKPATLARIAPGTECVPSPIDKATMPSRITRMPRWQTAMGSGGSMLNLDVILTISAGADGMYDMRKETALTALKDVRTTTDSRSVGDLGDEAHVVHAVDKELASLAEAQVIVRSGNAVLAVRYTYDTEDPGKNQQQSEDAVITAARDVLGSIS